MIQRLGVSVDDIAGHSWRKGARSYVAGGSTAGPSTAAALQRGGWAQEKMDKSYVRYEGAADQLIGRHLSMLNVHTADFGALPPHFDHVDGEVIAAVNDCFPGAVPELQGVLLHCVASLIHHREHLRRVLKPNHPVFQSILFAQGIVDRLAPRVALTFEHDTMTASGVPPHVSIMAELRKAKSALEAMPGMVREAIHTEFEDRAFQTGTITRDNLQAMINGMGQRIEERMERQLQAHGVGAPAGAEAAPAAAADRPSTLGTSMVCCAAHLRPFLSTLCFPHALSGSFIASGMWRSTSGLTAT
jgi:hypothetical protein